MTVAQLAYRLYQNPASPLFARLASEYLAAGRPGDARALCRSGIENFPTYATGYVVLAKCCEAEEDYSAAMQSLSCALEILPFTPFLLDLDWGCFADQLDDNAHWGVDQRAIVNERLLSPAHT